MTAPRWFWAILAGCCVLVSVALAWHLARPPHDTGDRWQLVGEYHNAAYNPRTGVLCAHGTCIDVRSGEPASVDFSSTAEPKRDSTGPFDDLPIARHPDSVRR